MRSFLEFVEKLVSFSCFLFLVGGKIRGIVYIFFRVFRCLRS